MGRRRAHGACEARGRVRHGGNRVRGGGRVHARKGAAVRMRGRGQAREKLRACVVGRRSVRDSLRMSVRGLRSCLLRHRRLVAWRSGVEAIRIASPPVLTSLPHRTSSRRRRRLFIVQAQELQIRGENDDKGFIVQAQEIRVEIPEESQEEEELEREIIDPPERRGRINGLEESFCSLNLRQNIDRLPASTSSTTTPDESTPECNTRTKVEPECESLFYVTKAEGRV